MFDGIRNKVRLYRAMTRLEKEINNMDKPAAQSVTLWGGILGAIGNAMSQWGAVLQDGVLDWGKLLTIALQTAGIILATFGARRAIGKAISAKVQ